MNQHPQGNKWLLGSSWAIPATYSENVSLGRGGLWRTGAGRTQHRSVVLGENLVLGPVRKHIDEIAQVPQAVSQGPDGEVPRGEWLQVPQVAISYEKDKLIPTTHHRQEEDQGCGGFGQAYGDIQASASLHGNPTPCAPWHRVSKWPWDYCTGQTR